MYAFRFLLLAAWAGMLVLTINALDTQGARPGAIFLADLQSHSWRAQFNGDFLIHLLLFALWIGWGHRFRPVGIVLGVVSVLAGGLFSIGYLLVLSLLNKGDVVSVLLGGHAGRMRGQP